MLYVLYNCFHPPPDGIYGFVVSQNIDINGQNLISLSSHVFQVYEDVSQCCQALSQRLGTQPYFFNKQYVSLCVYVWVCVYLTDASLLRLVSLSVIATEYENSNVVAEGRSILQFFSNMLSPCRFCSVAELTGVPDKKEISVWKHLTALSLAPPCGVIL